MVERCQPDEVDNADQSRSIWTVGAMTTFRDALRNRDFALTAELNLTETASAAGVMAQGSMLRDVVDGIQITDNPYGRVQMSPLAAASLLLQADIDAIPQMTCRDRNRTALESDLIGARALGVESLIAMRGHGTPDGPTPVFDIGAKQLIAAAHSYSEDEDPHSFHIGCVATMFKPVAGWQPDELKAKADSGAQFIQTQLCFDMDVLRRYVARLVAAKLTWRTSVVVAVAALPSAESAQWLQRNLRGALMPEEVVQRLEAAQDPEHEGVKICAELLQELAEIPGVSGAHVMTPGDTETIRDAIQASGLRA
jgi:methylenetetrahydrofolate reductase (NADPH)